VVGEPATMGRMAGGTGFTLAEHYAIGVDTSMRRELIDGALIVSPFASLKHALAASRLHDILSAARPRDLLVLGTINVDREPATNLQPDLTVVSKDALDRPATEIRPLLVVEILSPSTRRFDLTVKRQLYAEFGVASYWIVDIIEPSVTILELVDGDYVETLRLVGIAHGEVSRPFPVTFAAADLTAV
jgi:Uma2 family endonuclease